MTAPTDQAHPSAGSDGATEHERRDRQLRDLRFLESLHDVLAGCRDLAAVYSSAVHRVAAAFSARGVCLAIYEPVAGTLAVSHAAGERTEWDVTPMMAAMEDERVLSHDDLLAVPIVSEGVASDGHDGAVRRKWGVLALMQPEQIGERYSASDRRTLRAAAAQIAAELDRRRDLLLDDVLEGLLRKTKPIDVYTHALRELRRFIRYDHSASVMTIQRGLAQITVRVEKLVEPRGSSATLIDSPRRGRVLPLTPTQSRFLGDLERPLRIDREDGAYLIAGRPADPGAAGLWRVLCLQSGSAEGSVLAYPLIFGGHMLGVLRLAARRPGAFEPIESHLRLLDRFARLLAVTLYRSELYHQSDRQLQAIKQIGRVITEPKPVTEICRQVLELAMRVLHVQVGSVGLLAGDGLLELAAQHGCTLAAPPILHVGEGVSGRVVQTGQSRAVPDTQAEPDHVVFNARVRSELIVPITYNREVMGFLAVESFEVGRFREEDEELVTFLEALANQAAIAIKTAELHFEAMKHLESARRLDASLSVAGVQDMLIEQMQDTVARLGAANRAKSEFLAAMSHDLRGPLNVIVGLANLLTDPHVAPTLSPDKQQESLEIIRSSGEVLATLIGNILDLSALEAGKVQASLGPVDAQAIFSYAEAMARTLADEHRHELAFSFSLDPAITTVTVDEEKFTRILINLISNAVKFTPEGGRVDVTATVEPHPNSAGVLHLAVADTGVGIPLDQQEVVFDPFQRVAGAAGGPRGSGLGLAVVRQLVDLHHGKVWVESEPGEGSTFHVLLPEALHGAGEEASRSAAPATLPESPPSGATPTRGIVLVVEDTPAHMDMMRLAVTSRGYTMHGVSSGEEALAYLEGERPDIILLDMQLPGIDGFSVAARIRSQVETHAIPIVAVTADALADTEERARASGCDAYLTKPIDLAALISTMDSVSQTKA
jgi:signal transduction histidine kinase/CheY-like chemotaxis protein